MKKTITFFLALLFASFVFSACRNNSTGVQDGMEGACAKDNMAKNEQSLSLANAQLYAALNAMFIGNLDSMNAIWAHDSDITDLGPFGGRLLGWDAVYAEFKKEADMKLGGKIICKDLVVHAGTDMGYTACTEVGENMSADGKPVTVSHRATNIFRLENGQWKLVHHHTDLSPQLQQAIGIEHK
jgi:ketosteroid isomerase-like protein